MSIYEGQPNKVTVTLFVSEPKINQRRKRSEYKRIVSKTTTVKPIEVLHNLFSIGHYITIFIERGQNWRDLKSIESLSTLFIRSFVVKTTYILMEVHRVYRSINTISTSFKESTNSDPIICTSSKRFGRAASNIWYYLNSFWKETQS